MRYSADCIETLEQRRLFSISIINGVLAIKGAGNEPNTIVVGLTSGGTAIEAKDSYPFRSTISTQTKVYPLTILRMVSIIGGNKSDLITIDQTNGSFPLLTHIKEGNGNDTVAGGDEPDLIRLGKGIDEVNSGNGNDSIFAGRGPDTIVGGSGNDQLHAGQGHDMLEAGDGSNIFVDPFGHTTLLGGSGADTYVLKNIKLDPDNDYNPAKDILKKWNPPTPKDNIATDIENDVLGALPYL